LKYARGIIIDAHDYVETKRIPDEQAQFFLTANQLLRCGVCVSWGLLVLWLGAGLLCVVLGLSVLRELQGHCFCM
jgi:hypothetical protein